MPLSLDRLQYGFDRDSRRTWRRRNLAQGWDQHFGYDGLGQVTAVARGDLNLNLSAVAAVPQGGEQWDYDETGNWARYQTFESGEVTLDQPRVHDRGNRLMQVGAGAGAVRVDRAGRMTELPPDGLGDWTESLQVKYDAWGRVAQVSQGETVLGEYAYDGLSRRVTRTVDDVDWHCYYSDTWRPLEERRDADTAPSMQYYWGVRHRDDLVRRDRATETPGTLDEKRYVLMDYYSPASIADESGAVTERYAFSAFGVRQILAPDFTPRTESESAWEFAFQGQFEDAETGWLDYGYRYYVPWLGRWTEKDPIGERGGLNLYAMVGNDAVNEVDFFGLVTISTPGGGSQYPDGNPTGDPRSSGGMSFMDGTITSPDMPPGAPPIPFTRLTAKIPKGKVCCIKPTKGGFTYGASSKRNKLKSLFKWLGRQSCDAICKRAAQAAEDGFINRLLAYAQQLLAAAGKSSTPCGEKLPPHASDETVIEVAGVHYSQTIDECDCTINLGTEAVHAYTI